MANNWDDTITADVGFVAYFKSDGELITVKYVGDDGAPKDPYKSKNTKDGISIKIIDIKSYEYIAFEKDNMRMCSIHTPGCRWIEFPC